MNAPWVKTLSVALVVSLTGGYFIYAGYTRPVPDELAQAPLNAVAANPPPAFIMAVDDSGSMRSQTQFGARDGLACIGGPSVTVNPSEQNTWVTTNYTSFFAPGTNRLYTGDAGSWCGYAMVTASRVDNSSSTDMAAIGSGVPFGRMIPPADTYGFARSSDFNPAYFNPSITYQPWRNADGTLWPNASPLATRIDPRPGVLTETINLTATRSTDRAYILNGMLLPAGTRYRVVTGDAPNGSIGTGGGGTLGAVQVSNGRRWGTNTTIQVEYVPSTFYMRGTGAAGTTAPVLPAAYAGVTRTWIAGVDCGTGCPGLYRYQIGPTNTAALQNFANWFSYYGNRNRAMVAAMTHSMSDVTRMRVGYATINSRPGAVAMRDVDNAVDKQALFNDMLTLPALYGTPNLDAVNWLGQQFQRTGSTAPIRHMCQKNAGMLFTDGYSNGGTPGAPAPTDARVTGFPFAPTGANTMAAIASRYYTLNLRPDLTAGMVPVPDGCTAATPDRRLDCQTNQHMNFYGITLGARGNVFNPNARPVQDPFVRQPSPGGVAPAGGNVPWPTVHTDNTVSTVDDIWHATVNTRGMYINASSPADITNAMRAVLSDVAGRANGIGSISLTGARVGAGSLTVAPGYSVANQGTDWYGSLTASNVINNAGKINYTTAWEAGARLTSQGDTGRIIRFGKSAASSSIKPTVAALDTASVTSLGALCSDALAFCTTTGTGNNNIVTLTGNNLSDALAYLRGNRAGETRATNTLRTRTGLLGDIINSTPVHVSSQEDYGYRRLADSGLSASYATYLASKASRPGVVYVGANDGMLHAFNAVDGKERFAYIPATSLGHMGNLLFPYRATGTQVFDHRYYVDGPIAVSDANYGGSWNTVLVGTAGAGGRGVFALNLGAGASPNTTPEVLWEINDQVGDVAIRNSIGHVLGKPVIVPVKEGGSVKWKAIFGNGYNSVGGKAVLFVVDINGTSAGNVRRIVAEETGAVGSNGLGNIVVLDRNGNDGYADTVYAADDNGAIWKFDLGSTATVVTKPLFAATSAGGTRQPITGGIEATAAAGGGVMLYFGTGSFSFLRDRADNSPQTFYAVADRSTGMPTTTGSRAGLLQQRVLASTAAGRTTSALPMPLGGKGWYLDLVRFDGVGVGERVVGNPRVENGVVFFPTYEPNTGTLCLTGGANWLYSLAALSGAAPGSGGVGDGTTAGVSGVPLATGSTDPVKDIAVMTLPRAGSLSDTASAEELSKRLEAQCTMVVQAPGAAPRYIVRPCGRQSWRQLK